MHGFGQVWRIQAWRKVLNIDKGQKLCKNDTKGKMVILQQNGRSHFLNP